MGMSCRLRRATSTLTGLDPCPSLDRVDRPPSQPLRYFTFHTVRFFFNSASAQFEAVPSVPAGFNGLLASARQVGHGHTGLNDIRGCIQRGVAGPGAAPWLPWCAGIRPPGAG